MQMITSSVSPRNEQLFEINTFESTDDLKDIIQDRTSQVKLMYMDLLRFDDPFLQQKDPKDFNKLKFKKKINFNNFITTQKTMNSPKKKQSNNKIHFKLILKPKKLAEQFNYLPNLTTVPTESDEVPKNNKYLLHTDRNKDDFFSKNDPVLLKLKIKKINCNNTTYNSNQTQISSDKILIDSTNLPTLRSAIKSNTKCSSIHFSHIKIKQVLPSIYKNFDGIQQVNKKIQSDLSKVIERNNKMVKKAKYQNFDKLKELYGDIDTDDKVFIYGKGSGKFLQHTKLLNDAASISKINSDTAFKAKQIIVNKFNLYQHKERTQQRDDLHTKVESLLTSMEDIHKSVLEKKSSY